MNFADSGVDHAKIKELFDIADLNHDGVIDKKELQQIIVLLELSFSEAALSKLFAALDKDNDGAITLQEFISGFGMLTKARPPPKRSPSLHGFIHDFNRAKGHQLFGKVDRNNDAFISVGELRAAVGKTMPEEDFQLLWKELDKNGDGKVSEDEFITTLEWLSVHVACDDHEKHEASLEKLTQQLLSSCIDTAQRALAKGATKTAHSIIEMIDLDTVTKTEKHTGITLLTPQQREQLNLIIENTKSSH